MKQEYGCSPKRVLRRVRYQTIRECIVRNPDMTGYGIALESGLRDEQALYKFLSSHYGTGLKELRNEIWSEQLKDKMDSVLAGTEPR
jgi:transcriptional regulator GlxA family with amidase domain